jgi:hypothetical protein
MSSLMIGTAHQIFSGNKIEKNEMGGACSAYGRKERHYRVLVGKPEGRRPLGRARRRWGITFRWIFRKYDVGYGLDLAGTG